MKKQHKKDIKPDSLYVCGLALLGIAAFLAVFLKLTGIKADRFVLPCLFQSVTGLYCPGCGGTRAAAALFRGEIRESLHYHPLVLYGTVLYGFYMLTNTIEYASRGKLKTGMQYRACYVWVGVLILVWHTVWKNAMLLLCGQPL